MSVSPAVSPIALDQLDLANFRQIEMVSETLRQSALSGVVAEWAQHPPFYAWRSGLPVTVCARGCDVRELYSDSNRFTVVAPDIPGYKVFDIFGGLESVLQMDGERHARIRRLMTPAFTPAAIARLEQAIEAIIENKLDAIVAKGSHFDAMTDFAHDIIVKVLLDASFELTPKQQKIFSNMNDAISLATEFEPGKSLPNDFLQAVGDVQQVITEIVAERRKNPGNDMISLLVTARDEGSGMTDAELFGQINSICSAGLGTTAAVIVNALHALVTHPNQKALLEQNPELISSTVEECLRFCGPGIHAFTRFATEDTTVGGVKILKDMPIIGAIQAAGFDSEEFDEPMRFDITRPPKPILAFGIGSHHCIGSRLGRLIMKKSLLAIIRRLPNLRLADENFTPVYRGFPGELSMKSLPLCYG
jgi:cytochrome P450